MNHFRGPYIFILHYIRGRWPLFSALLLAAVAAATCAVVSQYAMKLLVDAMAGPTGAGNGIWAILGLFIGLIVVESVLWRSTGWLACRFTVGVGVDMRLDLFRFLNAQPMKYFAENLAGSLGQRITATAGNFGSLGNGIVWRILPPCVDFLGALVIFAVVDWHMMVALAAFAISITASLCWFGEKGRPLHRVYAAEAGTVAGELVDVITNMWAVKAFSAREREIARLAERFGTEAAMQTRSWMYTEKARVIHDVSLWVLSGGMLAWAIHLWLAGAITPGDVVVVSALTFRILHSSRDLALAVVDATQQIGFIEDTLRVIAQPPVVVDRPAAPALERKGGTIEFRDADFTYPTGLRAIKSMSLSIPAAQKIGIVGPSGAGKSTMIHLIQRLFDVDAGEIIIDGQRVGGVQQETLRDVLAVVPQEVSLFHRSVAENIRFGRPDASDEEVVEAARAASCDEFVRRLSKGYETIVGERGAKLSGGQRQRVGIARAFLKNAGIIILDEATSALDSESEIAIREALLDRMHDRTVIAVSHRLSMLAGFDRVIVVQDGSVVEDGAPEELRRSGALFRRLWLLQSEKLLACR